MQVKEAFSLVANGDDSIRSRSWRHVLVAQSVRVGDRAVSQDGDVLERLEPDLWIVRKAGSIAGAYQAGMKVPTRVLFWRMNGLVRRMGVQQVTIGGLKAA